MRFGEKGIGDRGLAEGVQEETVNELRYQSTDHEGRTIGSAANRSVSAYLRDARDDDCASLIHAVASPQP